MKLAENTIQEVQLTEKGTRLAESDNQYIFKVARDANKVQVKQAVERLFGVHVEKINTFNRQGKKKRSGGAREGRRASWKRAIVTLKDGETIDFT